MTKIIESIVVDVMCDMTWSLGENRCHAQAEATIIEIVRPDGRQDLVLFPVGWQATQSGDSREDVPMIGALCPKHRVSPGKGTEA